MCSQQRAHLEIQQMAEPFEEGSSYTSCISSLTMRLLQQKAASDVLTAPASCSRGQMFAAAAFRQ